jgi:glycine/D-amino acid oxidase-like deaminating enzyme
MRGVTLDRPDAGTAPPAGLDVTEADLVFAVVGDTRPPVEDDTAAYPTDVITQIWQDVQAESPRPPFAVTTGDYMYASETKDQQQAQLDLYFQARSEYGGTVYAAVGNHECGPFAATSSNCGTGTLAGKQVYKITHNYSAFLDRFVRPLGISDPWYTVHVTAADGTWTAKIVIVAANAWVDAQADWLESAMSEATDYTFVIRHEPSYATEAPGTGPSQAIIDRHPYTLLIVGHSHKYAHLAGREVIVGNGGAPLTSGSAYGYALVRRRADGAIQLEAREYMSQNVVDSFAVNADGSPAH